MRDDVERLRALLSGGACCAVALVRMGLEARGERNDRLLQAVSGLCGGVQGGLACGALTGAACMMNVLEPERANAHMVPELAAWFSETMGADYGGVNCRDITGGDPLDKKMRCPALVEATYVQAKEIMKAYGCEFD